MIFPEFEKFSLYESVPTTTSDRTILHSGKENQGQALPDEKLADTNQLGKPQGSDAPRSSPAKTEIVLLGKITETREFCSCIPEPNPPMDGYEYVCPTCRKVIRKTVVS